MAKVTIDVLDVEYLKEIVESFNIVIDNIAIDKITNQPGCLEVTISGSAADVANFIENEYCMGMGKEDTLYYLSTIEN